MWFSHLYSFLNVWCPSDKIHCGFHFFLEAISNHCCSMVISMLKKSCSLFVKAFSLTFNHIFPIKIFCIFVLLFVSVLLVFSINLVNTQRGHIIFIPHDRLKSIQLFLFFVGVGLFCFKFIYFIFGCVGSSLLRTGFLQLRRVGGLLLVEVCRLLIAVASLVAEHGLQARGLQQSWHVSSVVVAHGLQSAGSVVVAHRLSCSMACGIFPDQGLNPCPLHWQADS